MLAGQVDTTGASTSVDLIMKEKNKVVAASTVFARVNNKKLEIKLIGGEDTEPHEFSISNI